MAALGYYRGILNKLKEIESAEPECKVFVKQMCGLAQQFQFETMCQVLAVTETSP